MSVKVLLGNVGNPDLRQDPDMLGYDTRNGYWVEAVDVDLHGTGMSM